MGDVEYVVGLGCLQPRVVRICVLLDFFLRGFGCCRRSFSEGGLWTSTSI